MKKSIVPSESNHNSFQILADATTKISTDRSDSVAITAIVGIVLSFITLLLVGVFTIYVTNQNPNQEINQVVE